MSPMYVDGRRRNIVVLLGAGASAEFGCPVTKTFLDKFARKLREDESRFLSSLLQLENVRDIEHIVEILDLLLETERLSAIPSLHGFFKRYNRSIDFGKKESWSRPLEGQVEWHKIVELTKTIERKITVSTFSEYQRKPEFFDKIKDYYGRFFSLMKPFMLNKSQFEIFTTNYDYVIEDYCYQSGYTLQYSVLDHTLNPEANPVPDEKYNLTKLHGSLNWVFNKQRGKIDVIDVQFPAPSDSALYGGNEFVLFGRKPNTSEKTEYKEMFNRLENKLAQTDICIVVGFAFRHAEINRMINESLVAKKPFQLLVMSRAPGGSIRRLVPRNKTRSEFRKRNRIVPIKAPFGTDKALNLLEKRLADSHLQ